MNNNLLDEIDYNKIVYDWNQTDKAYPKDKTIQQLFEEQVQRTPDNIALVYGDIQLSYLELNEKVNQLSRHIRITYQQREMHELQADSLIAICLDRGPELVVAILAILKAGAAYVPIEPSYPHERINYILADTKARLVLTNAHLVNHENFNLINELDKQTNESVYRRIYLPKDKVICIDLSNELYKNQDNSNLASINKSTDLAYVIYTSGTTGKPKGVMIEHKALISRIFFYLNSHLVIPNELEIMK